MKDRKEPFDAADYAPRTCRQDADQKWKKPTAGLVRKIPAPKPIGNGEGDEGIFYPSAWLGLCTTNAEI